MDRDKFFNEFMLRQGYTYRHLTCPHSYDHRFECKWCGLPPQHLNNLRLMQKGFFAAFALFVDEPDQKGSV